MYMYGWNAVPLKEPTVLYFDKIEQQIIVQSKVLTA